MMPLFEVFADTAIVEAENEEDAMEKAMLKGDFDPVKAVPAGDA